MINADETNHVKLIQYIIENLSLNSSSCGGGRKIILKKMSETYHLSIKSTWQYKPNLAQNVLR
jgi:hypothetical protein